MRKVQDPLFPLGHGKSPTLGEEDDDLMKITDTGETGQTELITPLHSKPGLLVYTVSEETRGISKPGYPCRALKE